MGRDASEPDASSQAGDMSDQAWVAETDDLVEEAPLSEVGEQFWKRYGSTAVLESRHPVEASASDQLLAQLLHATREGDPQDSSTQWANKNDRNHAMELWGDVLDLWSSYSLEQLDHMPLPPGHPLFIRRENLKRQKQKNDNIDEAQPDVSAQPRDTVYEGRQAHPDTTEYLLFNPLEEASLREERAHFWEEHKQQKLQRKTDEEAQQPKAPQIPEPHDDDEACANPPV